MDKEGMEPLGCDFDGCCDTAEVVARKELCVDTGSTRVRKDKGKERDDNHPIVILARRTLAKRAMVWRTA
jgi:hypothetical protein